MPTASETVPNKALSGSELKQILIEDFVKLVSQDSMLADHLAYGRIAYDITLRMHVDNPFTIGIPHSTKAASKWVGRNIIESAPGKEDIAPELATLETFPLGGTSHEAVPDGQQLARNIDSPNAERLRMGMPVPMEVKLRDGSTRTETVKYPPSGEEGNIEITDVTPQVAQAIKDEAK